LQRTQGTDRDRDRIGTRGQTVIYGANRTYGISQIKELRLVGFDRINRSVGIRQDKEYRLL
jgi:hypothetical protein